MMRTTYAIFAHGTFWGVIDAESETEAIEAAAREWGTEGYLDGIGAVEITLEQKAALDAWADDGQPAAAIPLSEQQEKLLEISMGAA